MPQLQGTKIQMQDSLGVNCLPAASNCGLTDFWTDLLYNHASHPTSVLTLGVSGDSPYHLHDPQIYNYGLHKVAKRITSHREILNYLLPLGEYFPK